MATGFTGIYPMAYAFFDEAGALARAPMMAQFAAMLRHKVHGVGVLGLATEVNKLSLAERHTVLDWAAEALGGRVPLCVTVAETSVAGQVEFAKAAVARGARWVILQPPPVRGLDEAGLVRFFGAVAGKLDVPVAIQNAPQYLGLGLSNAGLKELHRQHPNFLIVKTEATSIAIERLIAETDGAIEVFNGRGGFEAPDAFRAGCPGLIPGAESYDRLTQCWNAMVAGKEAEAEAAYRDALPVITFLEDSMDHYVAFGKIVAARRLGLPGIYNRVPTMATTAFGIAAAERHAKALGPL